MDFLEGLQNKLGHVFKIKLIQEGIYLIERTGDELAILYYLAESEKKHSLELRKPPVIHIDEDLWKTKPAALLNRLSTLFGNAKRSHARETVVARIDKKTAVEFQEEHHLQGALSGKYRYGLFKEGELLAVAVFSGLRQMKHTENYRSIELLHFCQKNQHLVIGGLSKLLAAMIRDFSPNDVMTYVDRDWSEGKKFESLGFKRISTTEPQCFKINKTTHSRQFIKGDNKGIDPMHYTIKNLGSIKMVKLIS
jgi:hypothetical protein